MAVVVLVLMLAALGAWIRSDVRDYRRFCSEPDPAYRLACFHRWTARAFLAFGGGGALALLAMGRWELLWSFPPEFDPVRGAVSTLVGRASSGGLLPGMMLGAVVGVAVAVVLGRRQRTTRPVASASANPILPRNAAERRAMVLLSLNAGFSEELFFRLALPVAATAATGNAWAGIALAVVVFGAMHAYQGWFGMVATMVAGVVFWVVFLASGWLWLAMLVHVVWDLAVLLLRPRVPPPMDEPR